MFIMGAKWGQVDTTPAFRAGQLGMDYDGKIYKYLRYLEGAAAVDGVAGEAAYYVKETVATAKNDAYDAVLYQCTSDLTDSNEIGAGIIQATISDEEWGWFQIKGQATMSIALTAGSDGDALTPTGADDGTLDVVVATAADSHICAWAWDATAKIIICDFPM